jgi:hypothetical protein
MVIGREKMVHPPKSVKMENLQWNPPPQPSLKAIRQKTILGARMPRSVHSLTKPNQTKFKPKIFNRIKTQELFSRDFVKLDYSPENFVNSFFKNEAPLTLIFLLSLNM